MSDLKSKSDFQMPKKVKNPMTDEERLALATKLDEELDDFINGLEKKKYSEGWPEDRWQEEMEKHPFFMTKLPEEGSLPPLLEGIQQLKYDENENTPLDLANSYKEDGNFNFKHKKYRMAILSYTEGIRKKCGNNELEAQLYNNRAAAQFCLGNYRSSYLDCKEALKLKPDYLKAKIKVAQCCVKIKKYKEAVQFCDEILEKKPEEELILKIRSEAVANEKLQERDMRKLNKQKKNMYDQLHSLKFAIEKRNIQIQSDKNILKSLELSIERPVLEKDVLSWPVFFLYPEYSTSDYIELFLENSRFYDHLLHMFSEPPHWDILKEYQPEKLAIYFESFDRNKLYKVNIFSTLSEVLSSRKFVVKEWKLSFFVLVKGSLAEGNFVKNYELTP